MKLKEIIEQNKFAITVEISPPKGVNVEKALSLADQIKDVTKIINVTDNQRSIMHLSSLGFSTLLAQRGFDPIYQAGCRDRNALALQADILGAYVLGIRNILAISGDYPSKGDNPTVRPVFDLDSVQLIETIKKLESGVDMFENKLDGSPKFSVGGVVNPGADPIELHIMKLEKKVELGAEFIQTQVVYDVDQFIKFRELTKHINAKIYLGILPLRSYKMANFMNEKVPGVSVPQEILDRMQKHDNEEEGLNIATEAIKKLRDYCDGIHFMVMNRVEIIKPILEKAQIQ